SFRRGEFGPVDRRVRSKRETVRLPLLNKRSAETSAASMLSIVNHSSVTTCGSTASRGQFASRCRNSTPERIHVAIRQRESVASGASVSTGRRTAVSLPDHRSRAIIEPTFPGDRGRGGGHDEVRGDSGGGRAKQPLSPPAAE